MVDNVRPRNIDSHIVERQSISDTSANAAIGIDDEHLFIPFMGEGTMQTIAQEHFHFEV